MGSHPRRRVRDVPNGNLRSAACLSLLEALLGKAACRGRVAERHERLRGVDAPGGQAGMADAELAPTRDGGDQVGVRVGGAVLGEPQPAPALKQQRGGKRAGGRVAELAGGGERVVGGGELLKLVEGVEQEGQRPQHRKPRRDGELVVKGEAGVGFGRSA
jgi:hypothetical protein